MTLEEVAIRQRNKLRKEFLAGDKLTAELEEREMRERHERRLAAVPTRPEFVWTGLCTSSIF